MYQYILKVDNWSHIDSFCASFKFNKKDKELFWQSLLKHIDLEKETIMRFILVSFADHFIEDDRIDKICEICSQLSNQPQLVQMANGWLLATIYINYPDKVISIVDKLDEKTYRYTKGKIHDSYRISKENKQRFDEVKYICQ